MVNDRVTETWTNEQCNVRGEDLSETLETS